MTDKELLKTASQFRSGILGSRGSTCHCYMVSAPLEGYLNSFCGVTCELTEGEVKLKNNTLWAHWWLTLSDGRILDPTADQFSTPDNKMPKVYLGNKPDWYRGVRK